LIAPAEFGIDALTDIDSLIDVDNLFESGGMASVLALTEGAQRALLKNAIALHRFRGTPWAIKQALASLGWTQVTLLEGQSNWGGTAFPPNQGWAVFRVTINLAATQSVSLGAAATAMAAVNFFKPARSRMDSVWFAVPPISDAAPRPSDKLTLSGIVKYQLDSARTPKDNALTYAIATAGLTDAHGPLVPAYDRHYRHSGITYGANEPEVADSALIVNGVAVLHGG
jgi:hypothetical protein